MKFYEFGLTKGQHDYKKSMQWKRELKICCRCSDAVIPGMTICEKHRKLTGDDRYMRRQKQQQIKYNSGICSRCESPRLEGYSTCLRCKISNSRKKQYAPTLDKNKRMAEWRSKVKNAVFIHYGGFKCACCGEDRRLFLSIDHIDGGGNSHRKSISGYKNYGGTSFYMWIVYNNFPLGFQVLCHNCNQGKHLNGGRCPHEDERIFAEQQTIA